MRDIWGLGENRPSLPAAGLHLAIPTLPTSPPPPDLAAAPSEWAQTWGAAPPGLGKNVPDLAVAAGPPPRRRRCPKVVDLPQIKK